KQIQSSFIHINLLDPPCRSFNFLYDPSSTIFPDSITMPPIEILCNWLSLRAPLVERPERGYNCLNRPIRIFFIVNIYKDYFPFLLNRGRCVPELSRSLHVITPLRISSDERNPRFRSWVGRVQYVGWIDVPNRG